MRRLACVLVLVAAACGERTGGKAGSAAPGVPPDAGAVTATASPLVGGSPIPAGWRTPENRDWVKGWQDLPAGQAPPVHVRADFDGDARDDDAWILLSTRDPAEWALFAFVSSAPEPLRLYRSTTETPQNYGIAKVEPGRYQTACGKGYDPCGDGEPAEVVLAHHGLDFSLSESSSELYFWDPQQKTFDSLATSD